MQIKTFQEYSRTQTTFTLNLGQEGPARLVLFVLVCKLLQVPTELLYLFMSYSVVIANPDASYAPMAFQPLQHALSSSLDESLLCYVIAMFDPEAKIHPTSSSFIGNYLIEVRMVLKDVV